MESSGQKAQSSSSETANRQLSSPLSPELLQPATRNMSEANSPTRNQKSKIIEAKPQSIKQKQSINSQLATRNPQQERSSFFTLQLELQSFYSSLLHYLKSPDHTISFISKYNHIGSRWPTEGIYSALLLSILQTSLIHHLTQ